MCKLSCNLRALTFSGSRDIIAYIATKLRARKARSHFSILVRVTGFLAPAIRPDQVSYATCITPYAMGVSPVANPDLEFMSSGRFQRSFAYPSARPDFRIRIRHWCRVLLHWYKAFGA
jgi:hypothetical protein